MQKLSHHNTLPKLAQEFYARWGFYPIAGGKGGTTTTVQTVIPPKTGPELEIEEINLRVARQQESQLALGRALQFPELALAGDIEGVDPEDPNIRELLERQISTQKFGREIEEEVTPRLLAQLKGEEFLSPGQEELLDELFGSQLQLGQEDIRRFAEELAGQRGLRLSDTPIGGEALRAQERLVRGLRGARAGAGLQFGGAQQLFTQSLQEFQANLRQQAFLNRLSLASAAPLSVNLAGLLARERVAGAPTTQRTKTSPSTLDILAGVGGFLSGAGTAAGGAAALSTARVKKNIRPLIDTYDDALEKIRQTPIFRFKYIWEGDESRDHIGPILEMAPEEITDDGVTVNMLDYAGLQHAALKAIDRKVLELSSSLREVA